jgi:hypothetical protein
MRAREGGDEWPHQADRLFDNRFLEEFQQPHARVAEGKLSTEYVRREYGVAVDPA